jgi:alkylation response protein AidB-like acyl-CoA dehydrogenase
MSASIDRRPDGFDLARVMQGETDLSEEQRRLRSEVGRWAREVARPRAHDLEWKLDPRERVPWDLVEECSRRGWRTLTVPEAYGGAGADALTLCVVVEELGAGDVGLAVIIDQALKVARIFSWLATPRQQEALFSELVADPRMVLAICLTEPEHGSDFILNTDFRFETTARRQNGGWVLNGHKRFISNGADASHYIVFATTDPHRPTNEGTTAFWLRPDMPGFEVVRIHEKISQRTMNNGELRFHDIRLPDEAVLGEVHKSFAGAKEVLRESAIEAGAIALGAGQAAFELALTHSFTRVQGGCPLIEHANVAIRLARMQTKLEAARSLIWRAAREVAQRGYDYRFGGIAKVFAVDTAVEVGLSAMEIHGGLAIMIEECGVDKPVRDAIAYLHSDGAQDTHLLRVAKLTREALALDEMSAEFVGVTP